MPKNDLSGPESYADLLWFGVLGILAACAAQGFKWTLASVERWFDRRPMPQPWRAMAGGALASGGWLGRRSRLKVY